MTITLDFMSRYLYRAGWIVTDGKWLHPELGWVIEMEKAFKGNYPQTICKLTPKGKKAFENYVEAIKKYLHL